MMENLKEIDLLLMAVPEDIHDNAWVQTAIKMLRDIAEIAKENEPVDDADARPVLHVTGDVTQERHLRDGWDGQCVPYGGDGNTRISALLTHNAGGNATERSEGRVDHNVGRHF